MNSLRSTLLNVTRLLVLSAVIGMAGVAVAEDQGKKEQAPARKKMLFEIFSPIMREIGTMNLQRSKVLSGPTAMKMKRDQSPGKQWEIGLGQSKFKISIQDAASENWTVADAQAMVEKIPPVYRRCLEIISEEGKDGLAFYKGLGGAHGSQNYINVEPGARARVLVHEAGHCFDQRARDSEPDIMDRWIEAIKKDDIGVSGYGNKVCHEDMAEFAKVYAYCLDPMAGRGMTRQLQKLSPARFALWEHILKKCKALPPVYLDKHFVPLGKTFGDNPKHEAKIISGPTEVTATKHVWPKKIPVPAKQWMIGLGKAKFKITIADEAKRWKIEDAMALVEKLPPIYLRGLEVVSDDGETGLTLFNGGSAFGVPQMIGAGAGVGAPVVAHEVGHVLDQEARKSDNEIMGKYALGKMHDGVHTSGYGDGPIHEDHAEFAKMYALCLDAGPEQLAKLRAMSPGRFAVWEKMLVLTGAMAAEAAAPPMGIDFDADYKKMQEQHEKMQPDLKQVNESVKEALELKEGKK